MKLLKATKQEEIKPEKESNGEPIDWNTSYDLAPTMPDWFKSSNPSQLGSPMKHILEAAASRLAKASNETWYVQHSSGQYLMAREYRTKPNQMTKDKKKAASDISEVGAQKVIKFFKLDPAEWKAVQG